MRGCVFFLLLCTSQVCGLPEDFVLSSGNVMGKVIVSQVEGNSTYMRESGELAALIPTVISFQLSDRQRNLRTAKFTYTWDLGNGKVIVGPEPFLQCSYTASGNYTFRLRIGADVTRTVRITGLFSKDLTVLDAIRSIEPSGPLSYNVDQNTSLTFLIAGSVPAWLCWRVSPDCRLPDPSSCNIVRLYENQFKLNYTFRSVGTHCLDLDAHNNISKLQISYNIYVQRNPLSHLVFILPCASVIIATIIFIIISVCRPQHGPLSKSKAHGADMNYHSFADTEETSMPDNPSSP